jgi:membrane protease YdiL (CAAX protease family)
MPDLRDTVFAPVGVAKTSAPAPPKSVHSARGWVLIGAPVLAFLLMAAMFAGAFNLVTQVPSPDRAEIAMLYARAMQSNAAHQALLILQDAFIIFAIWLLLPKKGPARLASYYQRVSRPVIVLAALSGVVLVAGLVTGLGELAANHYVTFHASKTEQELAPSSLLDLIPALLVGSIVAPLAEELYFRGVLLRWLRSRLPLVASILISAALFALLHFKFTEHIGLEGWVLTAGIFTVGILAAAWSIGTRSLWPSTIAHGTYNAIAISLPFLAGFLNR